MRFVFSLFFFGILGATISHADEENPRDIVLGIPDCVAFWDFSESSGAAISLTSNAYPLKEADGSVSRINEGPFGRSADLREGSAHFATPSDELPELNIYKGGVNEHMTVVAWIKPNITRGFIAGKWAEGKEGSFSPGKRQYGLFIGLDGSNQVVGHVSLTGNNSPGFPYNNDKSYSGQIISPGVWSCVAFTYDGEYIRSYYNGVFEPNGDRNPYAYTDGAGDNGADFTIGRNEYRGQMGNIYRGLIGGVAVYSRPLTAGELATLAAIGTTALPIPEVEPVVLTDSEFTYEQDFDRLSDVNGLVSSWLNGATLKGWYGNINGLMAESYLAWDGTGPEQSQLLSLGSNGVEDRALGSQTNNSGGLIQMGLVLQNKTKTKLNMLHLCYDAEQWRSVVNDGVDNYTVEYQVFESGSGFIDAPSGWETVEELTFASPIVGNVTTALDGNASENRSEALSAILSDLNWGRGDELWIRWTDAGSERQMMGIDNVQIKAILPPDVALSISSEGLLHVGFDRFFSEFLNYRVQGSRDLVNWTDLEYSETSFANEVGLDGKILEEMYYFLRVQMDPL